MRRLLLTAFEVLPLLTIAASAKAVCPQSDFEPGWLWNYDGTIGDKSRVRLTLTRAGNQIGGVYFYATQLKDIRVAGQISADGRLSLDELDPSGKVTAHFEASFPEHDPRGKRQGTLSCEIITGSWQKAEGGQSLPLYLSLQEQTSGTLAHRYSIAGAQDDALINRNAARFRQAVIVGDKSVVAALIDYPVKAHVAGKVKTIRNRQELIAQYGGIFSSAYREAIAAALPRNMFVRDQGIMLGNGEVWFGADGKVIALNN